MINHINTYYEQKFHKFYLNQYQTHEQVKWVKLPQYQLYWVKIVDFFY